MGVWKDNPSMKTAFPPQPLPPQNFKNKIRETSPPQAPNRQKKPTHKKKKIPGVFNTVFFQDHNYQEFWHLGNQVTNLKLCFLSKSSAANHNTVHLFLKALQRSCNEKPKVYMRILAPSTKTSCQLDKDCLVMVLVWVLNIA